MAKNNNDGAQQDNAQPRKLDESPREGGLYIVNGRVVDAVGKVLTDWTVDNDGNPAQVVDAGK